MIIAPWKSLNRLLQYCQLSPKWYFVIFVQWIGRKHVFGRHLMLPVQLEPSSLYRAPSTVECIAVGVLSLTRLVLIAVLMFSRTLKVSATDEANVASRLQMNGWPVLKAPVKNICNHIWKLNIHVILVKFVHSVLSDTMTYSINKCTCTCGNMHTVSNMSELVTH